MKFFGQVVNVGLLPIDVANDIVTSVADYSDTGEAMQRTRERIRLIKDESQDKA
jgi:hypothetical protein